MLQYWLYERAAIFEPMNGLEDKTPTGNKMRAPKY